MTQLDFPLEIKTLIIRELSPYSSIFNPRQTPVSQDEKAAYFRDLCTVCLVWADTIAIIRKIIFKSISIRSNNHHIDASLRHLCQALENDPNLSTFVTILEFSGWKPNSVLTQNPPFIPATSRPLLLSFLSFIPKLHTLACLRLDNMHFHEDTNIEFLDDLRILKESSVTYLTLTNSSFSISAFNTFFGYWDDMELEEVRINGISLTPSTSASEEMYVPEDRIYDWDDEDTWTEWEVDKPCTATLFVADLELTLPESPGCGMLMLLDFLASYEWSPVGDVNSLAILGSDSAMTTATVIRINNLIRRYEPSSLWLNGFTDFEDAPGTPLYLGGVKFTRIGLNVCEHFNVLFDGDEEYFEWYIESLAAVPPHSRLQELMLHLTLLDPLEAKDLGSQGVWARILDSALSADNLQLDILTIEVFLLRKFYPTGPDTRALKKLETWLMETCFPKAIAKYPMRNEDTGEEKRTSSLVIWIGGEKFDTTKQ